MLKITTRTDPAKILPPQHFECHGRSVNLPPAKGLMLAILRKAIIDFEENVAAKNGRRRSLFRQAKDWIFDEGTAWLFSFENICRVLGLHPDYLRGGLLLASAKKLRCSPRHSKLVANDFS